MTMREQIILIRKRFYDKITTYKFVRTCSLIVIISYLLLLIIGVIIATFFGTTNYRIWTHWISDLGTLKHTPAPYLYDAAAIIAGTLTIPLTFYLEKILAPMPQKPNEYNRYSRLRYRIASYGFLWNMIGNLGYIGVGIWSGDRDYPVPLLGMGSHGLMSTLAFGGFTFGAFFMGWLIVLYDTEVPKWIGIYGIIGPLGTIILYLIIGGPLWEWILLFSILVWIIPLALMIFHKLF